MTEQANGALAGIRVVDLTRILAGPLCTMMLGDMGAEIIKVEPPGSGRRHPHLGPALRRRRGGLFPRRQPQQALADAQHGGARRADDPAQLIERADVLVDNFKLGTLAKWGFTDAWFDEHAPRLVRCSITGYGSSGPEGALPGYDFILQAESGLMSICGARRRRPDQIRRRHRRRVHRHARLQLDPGRAQRARAAPARARRSRSRSTRARSPCWSTSRPMYLVAGQGRRPLRQRSSEHRALHDLCGGRRHDGARGRQRHPVRQMRRRARPSRMGAGCALRHQPRARREPRA